MIQIRYALGYRTTNLDLWYNAGIMRILIATPIYPPEIGGPATYVHELCDRLGKTHDITVLAYTDEGEAFPHTRLISVSKRWPLPVRLSIYFIKLLRVAKNFDVMYVQNAMASGLPVALVSIVTKVPFVLKFVGDEAWERATQKILTTKNLQDFLASPDGGSRVRLMMYVQGFVLRRASIITTPSKYLSEELIKNYGVKRERTVVNYNAVEQTMIKPFDLNPVSHQIAVTARLTKWKGVAGVIRVVALLQNKFPDVRLVIAGGGPELDNLKRLTLTSGLTQRVTFLGNISRAETWRLRQNSEVYVLNSTYEGLPHTVLTSFVAKIPVVATNIPGTDEAVYDGKTGLLVPPGNDQALADGIARIFNNPALGMQLADNGVKLLKEKFSWDSHMHILNQILETTGTKPVN